MPELWFIMWLKNKECQTLKEWILLGFNTLKTSQKILNNNNITKIRKTDINKHKCRMSDFIHGWKICRTIAHKWHKKLKRQGLDQNWSKWINICHTLASKMYPVIFGPHNFN